MNLEEELSMVIRGLRRLFSFPGYRLMEATFSADVVQVRLARDRRYRLRCPHCGAKAWVDRREVRAARDLPFGPAMHVWITYPASRFRCSACGRRGWVTPAEIDARRRVTHRLLRWAAHLARDLPLRKAAALLEVGDTRLGRWDRAVLQEHLAPPDLDNLRVLMVDEKAIGRGHQYVTVVLDGDTGELLHLHEGRKKASLQAFFDRLTEAQKARIQAVCVDRLGAYVECIEEALPGAQIVYDKFHLLVNFHRIVDEVRRQEWNQARRTHAPQRAKLIKGQRYNLLRRAERNTPAQRRRLEELLAMNEPLSKVYLLLEDLRAALGERRAATAERALRLWVQTALDSGLRPVVHFARRLERGLHRIVNAVRFGLNNGRLEGFNNLIARIIHRACGYQDQAYLFLKLRQASLPAEQQVPVLQK